MSETDPLLRGESGRPEVQNDPTDEGSCASQKEHITHKRRWYILVIFSMMAFTQSLAWNTWGPISASAMFAYGWSNAMLALIVSWGPIMFMLSVFPFSWIIETKGLRWASLIAAGFLVTGCGVRCITQTTPYATWLTNLGQCCVSITGPMAMSAVTSMSATWFPPSQRTTATALSSRIMSLGGGLPFILGPYLVTDIGTIDNTTLHSNRSEVVDIIKSDISRVLYIELALAVAIIVAMVIYFPAKPPTPPSVSGSQAKFSFREGVKKIFRTGNFWLLGLPYALSYGIMVGWSSTLDLNLQYFQISQKEAGLIGFVGSLAGIFTGLALARLVDFLKGRTKPTVICLYLAATAGSLLFALVCEQVIPFNKASLYVGRIVSAAAYSALPALVFETLCEACFPVPESVTNAFITLMKNVWLLVFLAILWIPSVGTLWMNWMFAGASALCIPLVLVFRETHGRLNIDYAQTSQDETESNHVINASVETLDT